MAGGAPVYARHSGAALPACAAVAPQQGTIAAGTAGRAGTAESAGASAAESHPTGAAGTAGGAGATGPTDAPVPE